MAAPAPLRRAASALAGLADAWREDDARVDDAREDDAREERGTQPGPAAARARKAQRPAARNQHIEEQHLHTQNRGEEEDVEEEEEEEDHDDDVDDVDDGFADGFEDDEASEDEASRDEEGNGRQCRAREEQKVQGGHGPRGAPRQASLRAVRSMNDLHKAAVAARVTQKDVVVVFGEMLARVARQNDDRERMLRHAGGRKPPAKDRMTAFEGYNVPKVSTEWFLWRLVYFLNKYPRVEETFFAEEVGPISADFSPGQRMAAAHERDAGALSRGLRALLLALVYVDRVVQRYPDSLVTSRSLHRVMLTAIFVATKFSDDFSLDTATFARMGGLTAKEVSCMEKDFCALIDFDLNITDLEFEEKCLRQLDAAFDIAARRSMAAEARSHGSPNHAQYGHHATARPTGSASAAISRATAVSRAGSGSAGVAASSPRHGLPPPPPLVVSMAAVPRVDTRKRPFAPPQA